MIFPPIFHSTNTWGAVPRTMMVAMVVKAVKKMRQRRSRTMAANLQSASTAAASCNQSTNQSSVRCDQSELSMPTSSSLILSVITLISLRINLSSLCRGRKTDTSSEEEGSGDLLELNIYFLTYWTSNKWSPSLVHISNVWDGVADVEGCVVALLYVQDIDQQRLGHVLSLVQLLQLLLHQYCLPCDLLTCHWSVYVENLWLVTHTWSLHHQQPGKILKKECLNPAWHHMSLSVSMIGIC